MSERGAINLEASATPEAFLLLLETAKSESLADDYMLKVSVGFMRDLAVWLLKLEAALTEVGCLDEHYCPASPLAFPVEDGDPPWPTCLRCAALSGSVATAEEKT